MLAILGGSFDPVHLGHLHLLKCVLELTEYDHVILVPAFLSNFKQDSVPNTDSKDRLAMLSLSLEDFEKENPQLLKNKKVTIDTLELDKGGVSYTIDTVKAIKEKYGIVGKLGVIIGDDHLKRLEAWYDFDGLLNEAKFVVFCRESKDHSDYKVPCGLKLQFVNSPILCASSTEVRNGVLDLVSPSVKEYIKEHALYNL